MRKYIRVTVTEVTEIPHDTSIIPNFTYRTMLIENYPGNADGYKFNRCQKLDQLIGSALAEIQTMPLDV